MNSLQASQHHRLPSASPVPIWHLRSPDQSTAIKQICRTLVRIVLAVAHETLQPIADGIADEVARFEAEYGMDLGIEVSVDEQAGSMRARSDGLRKWGPRQVIAGAVTRAGLRHDVLMPSATIVVYPSTDQGQKAGTSPPEPNRDAALADLRRQLVANGTAPEVRHRGPADGGTVPLHRLLRPLVPGGSLARGTIVAVPPRTGAIAVGAGGISYATLALVAGPPPAALGPASSASPTSESQPHPGSAPTCPRC